MCSEPPTLHSNAFSYQLPPPHLFFTGSLLAEQWLSPEDGRSIEQFCRLFFHPSCSASIHELGMLCVHGKQPTKKVPPAGHILKMRTNPLLMAFLG